MPPRPTSQGVLFENDEPQHLPALDPEVRANALQLMVQWMQAVAMAIEREGHDEQDHR
jgi:hypothetical protein